MYHFSPQIEIYIIHNWYTAHRLVLLIESATDRSLSSEIRDFQIHSRVAGLDNNNDDDDDGDNPAEMSSLCLALYLYSNVRAALGGFARARSWRPDAAAL